MKKYTIILILIAFSIEGCAHIRQHYPKTPDYTLRNTPVALIRSEPVGLSHKLFMVRAKKKDAPPLLLLHELPGLSPDTLFFSEYLSKDFNVYVPLLFGSPNQNNVILGFFSYILNGEWWERESLHGSRPITKWASTVIDHIKREHPNHSIGVIGMCLTGAMPLSLLHHKEIKAVVLAQPTLPLIGDDDDLGISNLEWNLVKQRAAANDVHIYGIRFEDDSIAKRAKHCRIKRELGKNIFQDGEIHTREYCGRDETGNYSICSNLHSTLTVGWRNDLPPDDPMQTHRREIKDFLNQWLYKKQPDN